MRTSGSGSGACGGSRIKCGGTCAWRGLSRTIRLVLVHETVHHKGLLIHRGGDNVAHRRDRKVRAPSIALRERRLHREVEAVAARLNVFDRNILQVAEPLPHGAAARHEHVESALARRFVRTGAAAWHFFGYCVDLLVGVGGSSAATEMQLATLRLVALPQSWRAWPLRSPESSVSGTAAHASKPLALSRWRAP